MNTKDNEIYQKFYDLERKLLSAKDALRFIANHSLQFDLDEIRYAALEALAAIDKN